VRRGVDIRDYGSGNVGASNVWQSVSRTLVVPVGVAQIAQGLAGVLIARALGYGDGAQVAAGLAAVVAHNWNPWLGFKGGRGVGLALGIMLVLSVPVLIAFTLIAVTGVPLRRVPEMMLAAIVAMPLTALVAGEPAALVAGLAALAVLLIAKRVAANGPPQAQYERPGVWLTRLVYDRDTHDREAWVHRNLPPRDDAAGHTDV
jgi:glycerol-3-phosphate acyltransferase PlsY